MKKILFLFFLLFSLSYSEVVTHTSTKTAQGKGTGATYEEAVNKALIEAISKMNGAKMNSNIFMGTNSVQHNKDRDFTKVYSDQISKQTGGKFDTYDVISESQSGGSYVVVVEIKNSKTTKSYKAPGLGNKQRRSLAVFNASYGDTRGLGENLKTHIISNLTKSRKFNILDRDN
ncbi:MAG: hypothetical protein IKK93_06420, partial [Campylobacter sp.]|nr:hypothetical protein [Campylobacter sp.]